MNKVVFIKNLSKQYNNLKLKVKKNHRTIDWLKLFTTIAIFLLTIWAYWYFVNVSSTKGYFLREETNKLEDKEFLYNIARLDMLEKEKEIWQEIQEDSLFNQNNIWKQPQWLPVNDRVVYIETKKRIVRN